MKRAKASPFTRRSAPDAWGHPLTAPHEALRFVATPAFRTPIDAALGARFAGLEIAVQQRPAEPLLQAFNAQATALRPQPGRRPDGRPDHVPMIPHLYLVATAVAADVGACRHHASPSAA